MFVEASYCNQTISQFVSNVDAKLRSSYGSSSSTVAG